MSMRNSLDSLAILLKASGVHSVLAHGSSWRCLSLSYGSTWNLWLFFFSIPAIQHHLYNHLFMTITQKTQVLPITRIAPSLEVLKDEALSNLGSWRCPCLWWGWKKRRFKIPPNPNHPGILRMRFLRTKEQRWNIYTVNTSPLHPLWQHWPLKAEQVPVNNTNLQVWYFSHFLPEKKRVTVHMRGKKNQSLN